MEVERNVDKDSVNLLFCNNSSEYFDIYQKKIRDGKGIISILDTEDIPIEIIKIKGENMKLMFKNDRNIFVWQYDNYYISGQTNLSKDDIIKNFKRD